MSRWAKALLLFAGTGVLAYFATIGCVQTVCSMRGSRSIVSALGLTAAQRTSLGELEDTYMARKRESCERLCEKRAQLIQLLKQPVPDRATIEVLVREIGEEQAGLEKNTMDHLLAVRERLEPAQRNRLTRTLTAELRQACEMTACGMTAGCAVMEEKR